MTHAANGHAIRLTVPEMYRRHRSPTWIEVEVPVFPVLENDLGIWARFFADVVKDWDAFDYGGNRISPSLDVFQEWLEPGSFAVLTAPFYREMAQWLMAQIKALATRPAPSTASDAIVFRFKLVKYPPKLREGCDDPKIADEIMRRLFNDGSGFRPREDEWREFSYDQIQLAIRDVQGRPPEWATPRWDGITEHWYPNGVLSLIEELRRYPDFYEVANEVIPDQRAPRKKRGRRIISHVNDLSAEQKKAARKYQQEVGRLGLRQKSNAAKLAGGEWDYRTLDRYLDLPGWQH